MKNFFSFMLVILLASCDEPESTTTNSSTSPANCKGEFTVKNENGLIVQRFDEHFVNSLGCVTDNLPLSTFEKQEIVRFEHNVQCSPQNIPSVTLLSKNNYYWPRNDSIYLDLNSETGQFRRLIVGKTASGVPLFQREIGCWFRRFDDVAESWGANVDFGDQILLDLENASSSLETHPMEVFRFDKNGTNWSMTRFDDNVDVSHLFCNPDGVPLEYCSEMRSGNAMYYNDITDANVRASLRSQALLIRSEFNFIEILKTSFEQKWNNTIANSKEFGTAEAIKNNYKFEFGVSGLPDVPMYVDRSIRAFLRGESSQMPRMDSSRLPPICYSSKQTVIVNGENIEIVGETCYVDGVYTFTQN